MNDVGTFLIWGAGLQIVALGGQFYAVWSRWPFNNEIAILALVTGLIGFLASIIFPAGEILFRIKLALLADCMANPNCWADLVFSSTWAGLATAGLIAQLALLYFRRAMRRGPKGS